MPTSIGYQDLAALIAHRPHVYASFAGAHLIASPLGSVERAAFGFTRPIGTIVSPLNFFQTVSFDPRALDAFAWKVDEGLTGHTVRQVEYPAVNRTNKGDRLPPTVPATIDPKSLPQLQPIDAPAAARPAAQPAAQGGPAAAAAPVIAPAPVHADVHAEGKDLAPSAPRVDAAKTAAPAAHDAAATALQADAANPASAAQATSLAAIAHANPATSVLMPAASRGEARGSAVAPRSAHTIDRSNVPDGGDGTAVIADGPPELPQPGGMQSQEMTARSGLGESFIGDPGLDHTAQIYFSGSIMGAPSGLQSWAPGAAPILTTSVETGVKMASLEDTDNDEYGDDETVSGKDESRVLSPAQRLGLAGPARAEAQKCLADAIYFEARGEVRKGQEAVAQVVMNRVFSGYYPHDVCGVVYQNSHHHLACQFTFACEGKNLNKIDEPDMWEQAKQIARDTLDGKIWLAEVGHATHYHAYWVHPSWVHEMTRLYRLGVHTFYRPRNWGDGDDEPMWGPNAPPSVVTADPASKAAYLRPDPEVLTENPVPNPAAAAEASVKGPEAAAEPAAEKVAIADKL